MEISYSDFTFQIFEIDFFQLLDFDCRFRFIIQIHAFIFRILFSASSTMNDSEFVNTPFFLHFSFFNISRSARMNRLAFPSVNRYFWYWYEYRKKHYISCQMIYIWMKLDNIFLLIECSISCSFETKTVESCIENITNSVWVNAILSIRKLSIF